MKRGKMRAVVQRVTSASVRVGDEVVGRIGKGLVVLLGVCAGDTTDDSIYLSEKIAHLRIFEDSDFRMNRSLIDTGGQMLVVSQFTLVADCRKGRRPSFAGAASPDKARELYLNFIEKTKGMEIRVEKGRFGEMMAVSLINDGPVTMILDSGKLF
jgi:D-tyrosyl-tRNA(Tyr) deacylase